jgi:hypothetical protein
MATSNRSREAPRSVTSPPRMAMLTFAKNPFELLGMQLLFGRCSLRYRRWGVPLSTGRSPRQESGIRTSCPEVAQAISPTTKGCIKIRPSRSDLRRCGASLRKRFTQTGASVRIIGHPASGARDNRAGGHRGTSSRSRFQVRLRSTQGRQSASGQSASDSECASHMYQYTSLTKPALIGKRIELRW